jgi:hypothetical protein
MVVFEWPFAGAISTLTSRMSRKHRRARMMRKLLISRSAQVSAFRSNTTSAAPRKT